MSCSGSDYLGLSAFLWRDCTDLVRLKRALMAGAVCGLGIREWDEGSWLRPYVLQHKFRNEADIPSKPARLPSYWTTNWGMRTLTWGSGPVATMI